MKDPVEVRPPGGDRLFVALRMEKSRDRISFTPLDDLPLDLCHSPAIETTVSKSCTKSVFAGFTDVVNCPIASSTD
jgi:hypothetical protein